jgi:hypothetical protein
MRALELAQDINLVVREFVPSLEELRSDDTRGNKMYSIPWAIADPQEATAAVNLYLDHCIRAYLDTILDDSNHLVWDIVTDKRPEKWRPKKAEEEDLETNELGTGSHVIRSRD